MKVRRLNDNGSLAQEIMVKGADDGPEQMRQGLLYPLQPNILEIEIKTAARGQAGIRC